MFTITVLYLGVSKELISIVLACAGGVEIPMRIMNGWFADSNVMSAYKQLAVCMLLSGLTALLCAIISGIAGK